MSSQTVRDEAQTEEPTVWLNTRLDNVFVPSVRVQLTWPDIEAAVQAGAIHPQEAHSLWADWADPSSTKRVAQPNAERVAEVTSVEPVFLPSSHTHPALVFLAGLVLGGSVVGLAMRFL